MDYIITIGDIINIVLCVLSFFLAAISVVTVVITLRQNSKMIESSTRPYVVAYGQVANFQSPSFYLVLKNFGQSAATIQSLKCDVDLIDYAYGVGHEPFGCIEGAFIAPQQKILCNIDPRKMRENKVKMFTFDIRYSFGTKEYQERFSINYEAFTQNVQSRASTDGKELKIMSYTLQDMVEKIM